MSKSRLFFSLLLAQAFALGAEATAAFAQDISTVAGGGPVGTHPALSVGLSPTGVSVADGGAYVSAQGHVFLLDALGGITVVAGNGGVGFSGDGGAATAATVNPAGICRDTAGNLYLVDYDSRRIRRIDVSTGTITTVAGNGARGFSGDGGPAIDASFFDANAIAVDSSGNLFVADTGNQRIRRIDAVSGIITTIAGSGIAGSFGDGGPATSASLAYPSGVAVDVAGNVFISEGARVRRVDAGTGIITTFAGITTSGFTGDGGPATAARLNNPVGIAFDASGNLFIADSSNLRIRRVDAATGVITTVAGNGSAGTAGDGGPALSANLLYPRGISVNAAGDILITDESNRVRRVGASSGVISTVAGNGSVGFDGDGQDANVTSLGLPDAAATDALGNLYIADAGDNRVRRVDAAVGTVTTVAGSGAFGFSGDGGAATSATLGGPGWVTLNPSGDLFITDEANHRVRKVDAATGLITTLAGGGDNFPDGVAATSAVLSSPQGLAADASGNLFIADRGYNRVLRVERSTGVIASVAGTSLAGYGGDGGLAINATLNAPTGIALDSYGNLFVADCFNHRIRRVDAATGIITTVAGDGVARFAGDGGTATSASLNYPLGAAVDSLGNLYIADGHAYRIRRVDGATGIITTFAGNGVYGFSGDGGPAILARVMPVSATIDQSDGSLLIADPINRRIRKVNLLADLSITVNDSADVVAPNQTLVYSIVVHNNGPAAVFGATVTDALSASLTGGSWTCVATSGGTCGTGTGSIQDSITLPSDGTATYSLSAILSGTGPVINAASVVAPPSVADPHPANNSANDTDVAPSVLAVGDIRTTLGNGKATQVWFPVAMDRASEESVSVQYQTSDGTANAGTDYTATSGTLVFDPGVTSISVPVSVKASGPSGSSRTFFLNLQNSTNAWIGDGQGAATIVRAKQ